MRPVTHYCRFVYLSLLFLLVLPFSAQAENYTVEGIHVEATGQTATEARQRAMSEAEGKGFFELIKRLSDEATATRLSQSHQGNISLMVQGTQINNEKMSATSYMADIVLSFNPDQIQALLAQSGITPTATADGTTANAPTLVLPLFTQNSQTVLLGGQNPWWDAWNNNQTNNSAVTFILPIGDLEDISMTQIEAVRSNNFEQLKALADKYHVSRIVVADATYGEDIETKNPALSVAIFDIKPDGTTNSSMEFSGAANQPMVELLAQGVNGLVAGLNNNWKNQQLSTEELNKILVKASFANLKEWQNIQRRLKSVETVQKTAVERVAGRYAVIALYSSGTAEELPQHLQQSGFAVTPGAPMPLIQLLTP